MPRSRLLTIGLIGAGRIGSSHAELLAHGVPGARLAAVADPVDDAAARLAGALGVAAAYTDAARDAPRIALARAESCRTGAPVALDAVRRPR